MVESNNLNNNQIYPNLINCPDCGNKVSKLAALCPTCGCPICENKSVVVKKKTGEKNKLIFLIIVFSSIILVALVFPIGYYTINYKIANQKAQEALFSEAEGHLVFKGLTKKINPNLVSYIDAGYLMELGEYKEASIEFISLGEYQDAVNIGTICGIAYAKELSEAGKDEEELEWLYSMQDMGYNGLDDLILATKFNIAVKKFEKCSVDSKEYIELTSEFKELYDAGCMNAHEYWLTSCFAASYYYYNQKDYTKSAEMISTIKDEGSEGRRLYDEMRELYEAKINQLYSLILSEQL